MNKSILIDSEGKREAAINFTKALNLDKKWRFKIEPYRANRSNAQNSLLFLWLTFWGNEIGYTKDEMYDVVVCQCWPVHEEELVCNDIKIPRQRRTSQLNTKKFTEFLNRIEMKACQTGTILPRPEDLYWEALGVEKRESPG